MVCKLLGLTYYVVIIIDSKKQSHNNNMNYKINDVDRFLDKKMSSQEGKSIVIDLQAKIDEEEMQLDIFKQNINHCNSQIALVEPVLKKATETLEKLSRHKPQTPDIRDNINKVKTLRDEYKAKKLTFEENSLIWNASGYITLISIEIKTMQKGLYSSNSEWDKRFFARQAYVIMYDAQIKIVNQIDKLLQRKGLNSVFTELNKEKDEIKNFFETNGKYISMIRNNISGHRDENIIRQLDIIQNINWSDSMKTTNEFEIIINRLGTLFKKLIEIGLINLDVVFKK